MASRESFGMQVALIVSVFLIIILSVTTFIFYNKSNSLTGELDRKDSELQAANTRQDEALAKYAVTRFMLTQGLVIEGVDPGTDWMQFIQEKLESELLNIPQAGQALQDDEVKSMVNNYYQHMAAFGLDGETERNYGNLPNYLLRVVSQGNDRYVTTQASNEKLIGEKTAIEDRETKKAEAFETRMVQAETDHQNEHSEFQKHKKQVDKSKSDLVTQLDNTRNKLQEEVATVTAEKDDFSKQVNNLEKVVGSQKVLLSQFKEKSFEAADGHVTVVNHKLRICFIDVGEADGLQRHQTFSVYPAGQTAVTDAPPKGSLEVIKLMEPHLAMCKITDDESYDLIAPGDIIHTPAWGPGRHVRFALAGFMDMDGDGTNDRDKLVNLIKLNGGVIDEDVTPQTRYLIEGERKTEQIGATEMTLAEQSAYSNKVRDANQIGVDRISIDKFLSYVGWRGDVDVITLGRGGSSNIKFDPSGGKRRKSTGSTSFDRRPPRGRDGAF